MNLSDVIFTSLCVTFKILRVKYKIVRTIFKRVNALLSSIVKLSIYLITLIWKRKIEFLYICVFTGLQILLYKNWPVTKYDSSVPKTKPIEALVHECCIPSNNSIRTNVFLVKTHKTASSTVQSVLLRFAKMNSLDVMDIKYESYYWPISDLSIRLNSRTPNRKYHILAQHIRYDSKLKSYQYPNTSMVTILRHPAKVFQSVYTSFKMNELMGISFQQFLNLSEKPSNLMALDSVFAYRGYNQMSVDLGFDIKRSKNTSAVAEFIEKIDRDFDLVMITEYMEASMVLLANLMGWPLEYVAHLHLNAKPPGFESYKLTLPDEDTLMDLNQVDSLLYHYFLRKFRKCIRQYGQERIRHQVQQLKMINKRLKERCVAYEIIAGLNMGQVKTMLHVPKNLSDLECVYSTTPSFGLNASPELVQKVYSYIGSRPSNAIQSNALEVAISLNQSQANTYTMNLFKKETLFRTITTTRKQKIILLFLCIKSLLLILYPNILKILKLDPIQAPTFSHVDSSPLERLTYNCCTLSNSSLRTNVYFVRTHKTASTTIHSVILRFAVLNSLDVLCVKSDLYYQPLSESSIQAETKTPNNKYHILAGKHIRYDPKLKLFQYPDTSMITSLRHPAMLFQSMYEYYNVTKSVGMTLEELLNAPVKPEVLSTSISSVTYHGYNHMSVDLGFDPIQAENKTAIVEFVEKIDRNFDLVMIAEHLDASFVLLANLMGWPLEYVAHLDFKVKHPESGRYKLTEQDKVTLMNLNQVDTLLYDHFLKKFHKCVQQYGEDRLNYQIGRLKIISLQLKEKCLTEKIINSSNKTVKYMPKKGSQMECDFSTPSRGLTDMACQKQVERLRSSKLHN